MYAVADVAFDLDILLTVREAAEALPTCVDRMVRRDIRPFVSQEWDKTMRQEPPRRQWPDEYPLEWQSERQRRAYFATNGFGKGIPYRRTHQFVRGWHVLADYSPSGLGEIAITHDSHIEQFVTGRRQQRFHAITGWPSSASALQRISLEANERLIAGWAWLIDDALKGRLTCA
jgi:hypothetical protein